MSSTVIMPPADPTIAAAIDLLKLVSDPVRAEAKLKEIAEAQAASARVMADAVARCDEARAQEKAAAERIAEAAVVVEHQRRVEAGNRRRTDEIDARERDIKTAHTLACDELDKRGAALVARESALTERERQAAEQFAQRERAQAARDSDILERIEAVEHREQAVSARETAHAEKVARLRAITE